MHNIFSVTQPDNSQRRWSSSGSDEIFGFFFVSIVIWVLEYFVIEILELFWEVVNKE